jgi:hypothetical protein
MRLLLASLLLCLASPAVAGQRATYADRDGKTLVILVADDGSARVDAGIEGQYGLWRDGQFYLIGREDNILRVTRIEDMAAALDQVMPPIFKALFGAAASDTKGSKVRIEAKGPRKIDGRDGLAFAVFGLDDSKPKESKLFVMSRDPALKPVGAAMEQFVVGTTILLAPLFGEMSAQMARDTRAIFSNGTPLDMEGSFRLVSVDTAKVAPADMALPGKPQSVDEIVKALKANAAQGSGEAAPQ